MVLPKAFEEMVYMANDLIRISTTLPSNPDKSRKGGYLAWFIWDPQDNLEVNLKDIGSVTHASEWLEYQRFAQEKNYRTFAHCLREPGEAVSSWQTRDRDRKMFGGSVLFPSEMHKGWVEGVSFSGAKEVVDEALSLVISKNLRRVPDDFVRRVLAISQNNEVYREMRQAYELH